MLETGVAPKMTNILINGNGMDTVYRTEGCRYLNKITLTFQ